MALIIKQDVHNIGFYIVYESHAPENSKLDEIGGFGKDGFKDIKSAIADARDYVEDFKDVIVFYGINSDGIMVLREHVFGYMSGDDFLSAA